MSTYPEANPFADPAESTSGRHPVNVGHLVMGVAFACIVAGWALYVGEVVDQDDLRWLAPVPWLAAGIIGVLAVVLGPWRRNRAAEAERLEAQRQHAAAVRTASLEDDLLGGSEG
ncbi:MAG: hypothetical protein ACI379_12610 [Nocardioides sp.]|uniref:hypothetical protein n=1 Tax=Nocardioides sp. TaxID=35761 RepID=UPI003F1088E1